MGLLELKPDRKLDFIAMGRAGVDLYAAQENTDFREVASFNKYVGGSPANIAAALVRRGASCGFLGKVSDDPLGEYVIHYLSGIGVDCSRILKEDGGTRTSLAITEMKRKDCSVVIYRNGSSDLAISGGELDEEYVKSAGAVIISGTALSASPSREAVFTVIEWARQSATKVILDVDYRPYSWGSPEEVAVYYTLAAEKCDVIIGNREEFDAMEFLRMPGNKDDARSAAVWFDHCAELVIIKHGKEGSYAWTGKGDPVRGPIFPAPNVRKPFGAGDAFAGNLLYELSTGTPLETALERGAAAASLVICGDSCSDASPTTPELMEFMKTYKDHQEEE